MKAVLSFLTAAALAAAGSVVVHTQPQQLPPEAAVQAEVQLEGALEVLVEDAPTGSRLRHLLEVGTRRVRLEFEGDAPYLVTGSRVRARGHMKDADTLALSPDASAIQTLALANANTFGEQRTIVMLVNFQNNQSQPYSWSTASQVTFQTTSDFYRENSFGQTWLTGDVYGWFTIPMDAPSSNCDYYTIASLAEQAATAAGAKLSDYSRRIIAFPSASGCAWWGMGNVGGNPSRAWVNGSYVLKVVAHEFGHNLGDYHSRSQPCDAGGCASVEYGDDHDVMGNPSSGHMNAFQKQRLGWLNYGSSPSIQDVTSDGTYWIDAYVPDGSAPKALRLLKSVDGSGYRTWYYVEARTETGFDSGIAPGVLVHTGYEATGNSSYQIDLDRATSTFDPLLDPGQTFTDSAIGLSLTTVSAGSSGAWVQVSYGGVPCAPAAPSLSLLPSPDVSVASGQPANFTLRALNNDSASCAPATFDLSSVLPAGWSSTFGQSSIQISAGATTDVALTIVQAEGAAGRNSFTAGAARQGSTSPGNSVAGSVSVISSLDVVLGIAKTRQSYKLNATVTAGGAPVAGANVIFVVTRPDGVTVTSNALTNSSGVATVSYKPGRKDPRGTYLVLATAAYGGLSGSASSQFSY